MTLPAAVSTATVVGTFLDLAGNAATGTVTFEAAPCRLVDSADDVILLGIPIVATLDVAGHFEIELVATDDPDLNPVVWTYLVTVRISVPVFASTPAPQSAAAREPTALTWRLRPDVQGCARLEIVNESDRHEHVIHAELIGADGQLLWSSGGPDYVLARTQRRLASPVCTPASSRGIHLRVTTESRTITLPAPDGSLFADSQRE